MQNRKQGSKGKKILRGIGCALVVLLLATAATVLVAGATPPAVPLTPAGQKQMQAVYVPMADGTRIAVRLSLPPDLQPGQQIPAILEATRYQTDVKPTFLLNLILKLGGDIKANQRIGHALTAAGYAYVRVDERGTNASFGTREMEWSKQDMQDIGQVIDWLVTQPWSDGQVATYGLSYSGNTAELAVALDNPHLVAAAPLYSDFEPLASGIMPGGISNTYLLENWSLMVAGDDANSMKSLFNGGLAPVDDDPDGRLLDQALQERHNIDVAQAFRTVTYFDDPLDDQYTAYALGPFHYRDEIQAAGIPFYVQVGWLDAGTVNGALERFLTYDNPQYLVIGPWNHSGSQVYDPFGETDEAQGLAGPEQEQSVIAFFDSVMQTDRPVPAERQIRYYTMGEGVWKTTGVWPVAGLATTPFYFYPDGSLRQTRPAGETGSSHYTVDFSATTGENNRWRTNLGALPLAYPDRAGEDARLLTYTSEPLAGDLEITGNPTVTLYVSSTATDGAFYVYLEAVSPGGQVIYITEGQLRALHRKETGEDVGRVVLGPRHAYDRAGGQQLVPGETVELRIGLFATSVLVKQGYRLRIAIAGHDASNFARIPQDADPTIEVQTNNTLASFVELPIKTGR